MVLFKQILSFPSHFKSRIQSLNDLKIFLTNIKNNNKLIIESSCHNYNQAIEFNDNRFSPRTHVKIYCSCESFKFEFANVLATYDGLYNSDFFIDNPSKIKNPYGIICGCKHIIALSQYIMKHLVSINRRIIKNGK